MNNKIKSMFFATPVLGVLCAGTVSAKQLRSNAKGLATCGGSCGVNKPCAQGCLCIFPMESGSPFCSAHPIPGASLVK
jgi:hypothetical protein